MRLSRTLGNKKQRTNRKGISRRLSGVTTTDRQVQDDVLLGNLFINIDTDEKSIIDSTGNYELVTENISIVDDTVGFYKSGCISFTNKSYIEVVNLLPHFGIEDFTIDWWEYIPKHSNSNISTIFSISNKSRVSPLLINNSRKNKNIFISSNSGDWDISSNKYIGDINYDQWIHWVVARCNRNFYTYRQGKLTNIWTNELPIDNSTSNLIIGSKEDDGFKGYIYNFRLTIDAILWTEEFKTTDSELYY